MKHLFFWMVCLITQISVAQNPISPHQFSPHQSEKDSLAFGKDNKQIIPSPKEVDKEVVKDLAPHVSIDSNTVKSEAKVLKQEFRGELEKGLNGLVLTDLKEDDLSERVDKLQNSYKKNERYQQIAGFDPNFDSELSTFGKNVVAEEWLNNQVSYARIFEEYPPEVFNDKMALKQHLSDLNQLSEEKTSLMESAELDKSVRNDYHKYLKGRKTADELAKSVKNSKAYKTNKSQRKSSKKLLKKINRLESREQQIKEEIKENKYLKHLQKEQKQGADYLNKIDEAGEYDEELYNKLNEQVKDEHVQSLLGNDYISGQMDLQQEDLGKVGVEIIKEEALQVLDSLGGGWKGDAEEIKKYTRRTEKEEVKELLVKDTRKRQLLPENTFFEGIVAFSKGDFSMFSLSPNVGYEFRNGLAVGLGLTLHHTRDTSAYIRTALDYKMFAKYMILKGLFFVQTEYVAMIPGISYIEVKEGAAGLKRTGVLIGGGCNLKIKGKNLLSLGIMYNLNRNMGVPTYDSPILVRLGIKPF